MSALLRRLMVFLTLCAAPDDPEPDPPAPADAAPEPDGGADTGDSSLDDLIDAADPDQSAPARADPDDSPAVKEARRRVAELEADNARLRASTPPPAPARDTQYENEEQQLAQARATGDANVIWWAEQNVKQNRAIRASQADSRQALTRAEDVRDLTQFEKLEVTNPKVYAKYHARIEQFAADMLNKGERPNRMLALRMMIGDDMLAGKIGTPKKAAAAPAARVDRGNPAPARGDTSRGNGKLSEKEAREKRLAGVQL